MPVQHSATKSHLWCFLSWGTPELPRWASISARLGDSITIQGNFMLPAHSTAELLRLFLQGVGFARQALFLLKVWHQFAPFSLQFPSCAGLSVKACAESWFVPRTNFWSFNPHWPAAVSNLSAFNDFASVCRYSDDGGFQDSHTLFHPWLFLIRPALQGARN